MENKDINIAEKLKNCPKGMKLYSTILGECTFEGVFGDKFPVTVRVNSDQLISFTAYGKMFDVAEAVCQLFPSKDNRDWTTFQAPKKEHEFKPFDKVLVRHYEGNTWRAGLFSHIEYHEGRKYYCANGEFHTYCIPYEGNEHLLGTTDSPDEKGGEQ